MNITSSIRSHVFLSVIIALVFVAIVTASFGIGELVGYQKAKFSYAWGEQYDRVFGGPRHGIFGAPGEPTFIDAHGTFGTVLKVDGTTLVIRGADNREKIIITDPMTQVQGAGAVSVNDRIVVIGMPNERGQIIAQFIRVFPKL